MLGLGRRDCRRVKQRQHTVFPRFARCAHGGHVQVRALEQGVEVATFEDEAVGAESKGEGHEEGDSEEGEPEKCEKVEGGDRNDK